MALCTGVRPQESTVLEYLQNCHVPEDHISLEADWRGWENNRFMQSVYFRPEYVKHSFVVINQHNINVIDTLIKQNVPEPIQALEVMAGKGWLSYWLRKKGLNIVATTDNHSWWNFDYANCPVNVEKLTALKALRKYHHNIVILSWPPMSNAALRVLEHVRRGVFVLYIGEDYEGCTANNAFFEYISTNCDVVTSEEDFYRFYGLYDRPKLIYKRR